MKRFKSLSNCNDLLRSIQKLNELESEQRSNLERARRKLNRLKRNGKIDREEVFEVVREIAEAVLNCTDGRRPGA
jgi:cell division FtsZ-interacting protein ZapD